MNKEYQILAGVGLLGAIGYITYLHTKINKVSSMVTIAVNKISSEVDVDISDALVEAAVEKAIDREVRYISTRVRQNIDSEIRGEVEKSVSVERDSVKKSVAKEIEKQVRNIDISDIEREVIKNAKDAVAEKFDRKLDGLLDDFNANLNNIQKIYSSISRTMIKE